MTCIVGIHSQGQTYIGSDSRACSGDAIMPTVARKFVDIAPGCAIGFSGDGRQFDLIQAIYGKRDSCDNLERHLDQYQWAESIIHAFKEAGFVADSDKRVGAPAYGFGCIFATPDAVYDIDGCGAVSRIDDGVLWARGSGRDFALGAAHALQELNITHPQQVAHEAVKAAIAFDGGCGGEIMLKRLSADGI